MQYKETQQYYYINQDYQYTRLRMGNHFCNEQTVMSHMALESQYTQNQNIFKTNLSEDRKQYIISNNLPCWKQKGDREKYFCGYFKDGKAEGNGIIFIPQHQYFQGILNRGLPNGEGCLQCLNRRYLYEGGFQGGVAHGKGKLRNNNDKIGFIFEGQWDHGEPLKGILTPLMNKQIQTIQILQFGQKQGIVNYKNGQIYEGQLNQYFEPHGSGKFTYSKNNIADYYEGQWFRGILHGKGTFKWKDGSLYDGSYINGRKQGKGKFVYPSGNQYEGDWLNGLQHGKGVVLNKDRNVIQQGVWIQGKLVVNMNNQKQGFPLQKIPVVNQSEMVYLNQQIK